MNGNIAWILSGLLAAAGIALYLVSGTGSLGTDIAKETTALRTQASKGIHSNDSVGKLRAGRDAVKSGFDARAAEFTSESVASISTNYFQVLKDLADRPQTADFATVHWNGLSTAFAQRFDAISAKTKRAPYWNGLGHRWLVEKGHYEYENAGTSTPPKRDNPIMAFDALVTQATQTWVTKSESGVHYGHLAVVSIDRVLKAIEDILASELANQTFEIDSIDVTTLDKGVSNEVYGADDPFLRWNFDLNVTIAPAKQAALMAALNAAFNKASSPSLRVVEVASRQARAPFGVSVKLTPEEAKALGFEVPTEIREFETWRVDEFPKIAAKATEARIGAVDLPCSMRIRIQASVAKDKPAALQFAATAKN